MDVSTGSEEDHTNQYLLRVLPYHLIHLRIPLLIQRHICPPPAYLSLSLPLPKRILKLSEKNK